MRRSPEVTLPEVTALTLSPLLERGLLCAAVGVATLVAFTHWRRGEARALREPLVVFFALWVVEGVLFAAAANPNLLPASLVQGLDFAAVVLLAWAFLASSLSPPVSGALLGSGMTLATALIVFSISAARLAGGEPTWMDPVWSIGSLIVSGGTAIALSLRRSPDRASGLIAAFAALAGSALLDMLLLPDLSRAGVLFAFSLFPIGLYQRALSDVRAIHETLREFSQSAFQQTQELATLLESSAYLPTSLDLDELLRKVVEHAAVGVDADRAIIVLNDESAPQTMRLSSSYPRGLVEAGQTFPLNTQPTLALAVSAGQPLTVGPRGQGASQLTRWLRMDRPGPMIVQPLSTQDNTIGALVAARAQAGRDFSDGQKQLLQALGAQIAAAIVNARLQRGLDTQSRELSRVLAEREQEVGWHTAILESIDDGVLVTDKSDQVILVNSAAIRQLDRPIEDILHRPLGAIFERMVPLAEAPIRDAPDLSTGSDKAGAVFELGDRALRVSMTLVRSLGGDRLGGVAILRDITPERRGEHSRAQFIARVAQEFRTPLATIQGYADLLARDAAGSLPPAARGFVETIRASAERLSAQVNAVLQLNELERGQIELNIEEADVASILADAANTYRPRFDARGLSLTLHVKRNLPSVRADRARVRQVLDQLIDNALKFTPDGGQVTISAAPSWNGQSERPVFVSVSVSDSGAGFDREESWRIFAAFYRGDHPPQVDQAGLGIGLSIARGLCETMGGHLWGRGEQGGGATFTFILPVARIPDRQPARAAMEAASPDSWIEQALSFLEDTDRGDAAPTG